MHKKQLSGDASVRYFLYLYNFVSPINDDGDISWYKLLKKLFLTPFKLQMSMDENRIEDGLTLRKKITELAGVNINILECNYPVSILEVMLALAIRCEESIMEDPAYGDRTRQWFWDMIKNLGLGSMYDIKYDENEVSEILSKFLSRQYSKDGSGGLFTIKEKNIDMTKIEIWEQLCRYLNQVIAR